MVLLHVVFLDNVLKIGVSLRQLLETLSQANSGYKIVIITTSTASDYRENSWVLRKLRPKTPS